MVEFIESPLYDNWFIKHIPKKSLIICSPYIKKNAVDEIFTMYNIEKNIDDLDLKILIRGSSEEFINNKSSDFSVLNSLIALPSFDISNVKRVENLHMKAYLVDDDYLLISSGNFTNSGLFVLRGEENFEGGISTDERSVIDKFKVYFEYIWDQGECLNDFYDALLLEYNKYLETEFSERKGYEKIAKKKYKFPSKTKIKDTMVKGKTKKRKKYNVSDFPKPSNFIYLLDTLKILKDNPEGLRQGELGKLLRIKYGCVDIDNKVSNNKFGEEKGKYAGYFDLATVTKDDRNNIVKITKLGELYLTNTEDNRLKHIKDVFFSKPAIVDIIEKACVEEVDLHNFINSSCDASKTTINRIVSPTRTLFKEIEKICEDPEIKLTLRNIK